MFKLLRLFFFSFPPMYALPPAPKPAHAWLLQPNRNVSTRTTQTKSAYWATGPPTAPSIDGAVFFISPQRLVDTRGVVATLKAEFINREGKLR